MDRRLLVFMSAVGSGVVFIGLLSLFLSEGFFADFLLDRNSKFMPYPVTVQNIMWLVFFIGAGELLLRYFQTDREIRQIDLGLLPEDDTTLLRKQDLGGVYQRVKETMHPASGHGGLVRQGAAAVDDSYFLQRLLSRCILQFQVSGAIDKANNMFNSSLELFQHEVELRYNTLRYIVWLIPTLGFIGTVVGIALALSDAGSVENYQDPTLLKQLTQSLGVAFFTTLLALLQSAVLMFALHVVQGMEESSLNRIGQYCLDNLINRLYET